MMEKTKYFARGEWIFSLTLAYFLTWNNALNLESWGWNEALVILWAFVTNLLVVGCLLWIITKWQKKPIFGQNKAYYFPLKTMVPVAIAGSILMGLIKYASDDLPMNPLHIAIYAIGFILGTVALLLCFYHLTKKEGNKGS